MKTEIYSMKNLKKAAEQIKAGEIVAFPTETVFGLGAIANNDEAIRKVYQVKGRPSDNPLIVHVSSIESVYEYVEEVNDVARNLMENFWPGPLTIIFPMKENVFSQVATNGQTTVAMRMPRQLETIMLIEMVGFPIVGPSANLSGRPSPTQVDHVLHDFDHKIAGIVTNHRELTEIGVESTVVYPMEDKVLILRPGMVTQSMLQTVLKVPVLEKTSAEQLNDQHVMSPGVKYTHYSPNKPVYLMSSKHSLEKWQQFIKQHPEKIGVLATQKVIDNVSERVDQCYCLGAEGDIYSATRHLFNGLRSLEQTDCDIILAEGFVLNDESRAYMNRLTKASNYVI